MTLATGLAQVRSENRVLQAQVTAVQQHLAATQTELTAAQVQHRRAQAASARSAGLCQPQHAEPPAHATQAACTRHRDRRLEALVLSYAARCRKALSYRQSRRSRPCCGIEN